ncbi:hypothetical protein [Microcoleus sp. herbarium14]|uniref:hypothetical protein n=1 Tax=Microcoleus sp. herbarium14 TaxID=3055439 RepID=UPI002FD0F3C2
MQTSYQVRLITYKTYTGDGAMGRWGDGAMGRSPERKKSMITIQPDMISDNVLLK